MQKWICNLLVLAKRNICSPYIFCEETFHWFQRSWRKMEQKTNSPTLLTSSFGKYPIQCPRQGYSPNLQNPQRRIEKLGIRWNIDSGMKTLRPLPFQHWQVWKKRVRVKMWIFVMTKSPVYSGRNHIPGNEFIINIFQLSGYWNLGLFLGIWMRKSFPRTNSFVFWFLIVLPHDLANNLLLPILPQGLQRVSTRMRDDLIMVWERAL